MRMRSLYLVFISFCVVFAGCVSINLPTVQPLVEKGIGGRGADKVLLIDISGVITDEADSNMLGVETGMNITARVREELTMASEDKSVKAVVLRINSPGGAVTTCDIISHEIEAFKKKRDIPVVAELMDVAASGGYYIAVSADKIIAHPMTVTGSIGVVAYSVNASGLMEKLGVADQTIKSGANKDIGSPLRPMSQDEREILQSVINEMYERFLDKITAGRPGLKRQELRRIADGRIYTAKQALHFGLIDSVGYLDDAIEVAKAAAHIKDARLVTYAPHSSYRNNIYSGMSPESREQAGLVNIDTGFLKRSFGMSFMYLWMP